MCGGLFFATQNTNVCPAGSVPLGTEAECVSAANKLGRIFDGKRNWFNMPKGCFNAHQHDFVYFNEHPTGSAFWESSPICSGEPDNTVRRYLATFSASSSTQVCYEQDSKYIPIDDIIGQGRTVESDVVGCQARCERVSGCSYFSFWANGGCHLSSSAATKAPGSLPGSSGVTAGPKACSASKDGCYAWPLQGMDWYSGVQGSNTWYVGASRMSGSHAQLKAQCFTSCNTAGGYKYYILHDNTACFCAKQDPTGPKDSSRCGSGGNELWTLPN